MPKSSPFSSLKKSSSVELNIKTLISVRECQLDYTFKNITLRRTHAILATTRFIEKKSKE
jgi:hypothetical protein